MQIEARKIATAPREPTQDTKIFSFNWRFERRETQGHGRRPGDRVGTSGTRYRAEHAISQTVRPGQQAEQNKHHDLRKPGDGIQKTTTELCARVCLLPTTRPAE